MGVRNVTFTAGKVFLYDDDSPFGSDQNMVDIPPHEVKISDSEPRGGWVDTVGHAGNEISLRIQTSCVWLEGDNIFVSIELFLHEDGEPVGRPGKINTTIELDEQQTVKSTRINGTDDSYAEMSVVITNHPF